MSGRTIAYRHKPARNSAVVRVFSKEYSHLSKLLKGNTIKQVDGVAYLVGTVCKDRVSSWEDATRNDNTEGGRHCV